MSDAGTDEFRYRDTSSSMSIMGSAVFPHPEYWRHEKLAAPSPIAAPVRLPRRTPRKSLIVVLPDDHVVEPETITRRLVSSDSDEVADVIVACAGEPRNLGLLQREVRDLQVLLAPAGTSGEDLRELAIGHVPGDIITLFSGVPIDA
jgi:hypothetical protein